jgi:hypothetical protein
MAIAPLTPRQRALLTLVALFGLLGPNGVFVYYVLFRWNDLLAGMRNPVALAFLIEAMVVMVLLAALIALRPVGRWGWKTFLALSLIGGLAFSIPTFILMNAPRRRDERDTQPAEVRGRS